VPDVIEVFLNKMQVENPTLKQCIEMLNISMGSIQHFSSWHTGI
jgi:hypothetical protein